MMYSLTVFEVSCQVILYCFEEYFVVYITMSLVRDCSFDVWMLGSGGNSAQGLRPTYCLYQDV